MKSLIALIFITLLSGCSRTELLDKMAPDDRKVQAIETLEALRKGTGEETFALLPDEQKNEEARRTLAMLAQGMPDYDYTSLTFVNYQWRKVNSQEFYYFVFEYDFEGHYLLADITLQKKGDDFWVAGLHANEVAESIVESSKFDFDNAGILHFGFLGAVILFPVLSIATLVVCIRTKGLKRKWLWCIFILIGFMSFKLNWSTGDWFWQPLSFQLLSSSAFSSGAYGPWILGFSVPVGAVAFWDKRKKLKAQPVDGDNVG
ncbi:hypothetical protein [Coraliomargarita parva]|uniref:hypothetical protein n=1 Tax=Coraliomargarita parva TaxID=3014050 RepID=UPI0022B2B38E|nr:hypothetical protein [Coraliomargarita parva]